MTVGCVVCGYGKPRFAFPLTREKNGSWQAKPVCGRCRRTLEAEAKLVGKSITFYGLEGSLKQAESRNAERVSFRPFLDAFARAGKTIPRNGKKPVEV